MAVVARAKSSMARVRALAISKVSMEQQRTKELIAKSRASASRRVSSERQLCSERISKLRDDAMARVAAEHQRGKEKLVKSRAEAAAAKVMAREAVAKLKAGTASIVSRERHLRSRAHKRA